VPGVDLVERQTIRHSRVSAKAGMPDRSSRIARTLHLPILTVLKGQAAFSPRTPVYNSNHFPANCWIRLSISCPTASPRITSACNFVLASTSEIHDSSGRTYGRSGLLMLREVILSDVDLICFPAYIWKWWSLSESPRDRWEEYLQLQFPTSIQIGWLSTTDVPSQPERVFDGSAASL
jgi:hypothetical protein